MNDKISVAEAKKNFISAMDKLSLKEMVGDHPVESLLVSAAAGAAAGFSRKRLSRALFPLFELLSMAARRFDR